MQTDGQEFLAQPVAEYPPANERKLIAPLWHTVFFIAIVIANSYFTAKSLPNMAAGATPKQRIFGYVFTIGWEIVLLLIVWFGIRLRGLKMKELIGGRWESIEDFLIDIGIALGYWLVAITVLGGLGYLLGLTKSAQAGDAKKLADMLGPESPAALAAFVLLSTVAGFVEEIIFRGYLQKQFAALTGSVYFGLILQAIVFGAGHGYEGARRMLLIAVFGAMFGLLALWRKSLRPGMMAHAWHDSIAGVALYLVKKGMIPMK